MGSPARRRRFTTRRTPQEQAHHREVMQVFTGLLLSLFVAMMSATIVGTALPVIIAELGGTQMQYTWIVTAAMLASTISTPIVGKLADLLDKKKLLLTSMAVFALGSVLSGLVDDAATLIAARVLQGVGMGAQMSMVQIAIASIIPPRERGRYNGYLGAVMAVATVSGPLIGGVIVDVPWLGWRWTFWSGVPFTLLAMWVIQRRLHIPTVRREVHIDYWGTALITASVTSLLLWLSFAGTVFPWASWSTVLMVGGGVLGAVAFVLVELRVREPIVPMWLLTERTTALAVVASFGVGTVMMSMPVFLGQYFQLGRGYGPTESGLMMAPMMLGVFLASTVAGRLVSAQGTWKRYVVGGVLVMAAGVGLMGVTVDAHTPLWLVGLAITVVGLGQGASMQNLVLAVQNTVGLANMGVATSVITFFRTLGGAVGVQVLGALFAKHVDDLVARRAQAAGVTAGPEDVATSSVDFAALPPAVEQLVREGYGDGMGLVFLAMAAFTLAGAVAVLFMRGSTLRDTVDLVQQAEVRAVLEDEGSAHQAGMVAATEAAQEGDVPATEPSAGGDASVNEDDEPTTS